MNYPSQLTFKPTSNLIKVGNPILADGMNDLLSDYNVFNQNVKGFHWNFIGPDFFDLHQKFEDLNEKLSKDIDKLADGIVTMGFVPLHSYSDFLRYSNLKEITRINSDDESVGCVISGLRELIAASLRTAKEAEAVEDIISEKLLRQFASELENELWIFTMFAKY